MEVLQTSALPLGDGAGRNWGSKLTWNVRPRLSTRPTATSGRSEGRKHHRSKVLPSRSAFITASSGSAFAPAPLRRDNLRVACQPLCARAEWLATRSAWPFINSPPPRLRRYGGHPSPESCANGGAGNGIRTRDFDLGKVALYH